MTTKRFDDCKLWEQEFFANDVTKIAINARRTKLFVCGQDTNGNEVILASLFDCEADMSLEFRRAIGLVYACQEQHRYFTTPNSFDDFKSTFELPHRKPITT